MEKLNMTIGRFQPFTQGHLNMVNEGEGPCIIYQIKPAEMPTDLKTWKISGKKVKPADIKAVVDFMNTGEGELTEFQKEIIKRPFTNELIAKELDIIKKTNPNVLDVVYVKNMYDALDRFNAFCTEHQDEYEPQFWMCGDDRVETYSENIGRYDELETALGNGNKIPNILKGKLTTNIGKGRTEGVSGTAVRQSIINNDQAAFAKIMPKGVSVLFNEFKEAFDKFKEILEGAIKEGFGMSSLRNYIYEHLNNE